MAPTASMATDGWPTYDRAMMIALILYAYVRGMRSSRAIERACEDHVAFRVIAANRAPDHATMVRFVERHQDALTELFGAVLEPISAAKTPRPGWDGGAYAFMRSVLAIEHGGALYRQGQHMVESVFADTKFNRRLDRFLRVSSRVVGESVA